MHRCVISMLIILLTAVSVSAQQNSPGATPGSLQPFHGTQLPNQKLGDGPAMASVVKKSKLSFSPSKTIGEAFDGYRYFAKREWKETPASGGKVYVDFTGWLRIRTSFLDVFDLEERPSNKAIGIKFMVDLNGSYSAVMVSRIEKKADGLLYSQPVEDLHGILKKIYENKEIKF